MFNYFVKIISIFVNLYIKLDTKAQSLIKIIIVLFPKLNATVFHIVLTLSLYINTMIYCVGIDFAISNKNENIILTNQVSLFAVF